MNGRVYDYNVGRFMSVDPVIQSPTNSQSLNPYSYIMNNPLAGTDPTGYTIEIIIRCGANQPGCDDHLPESDDPGNKDEGGQGRSKGGQGGGSSSSNGSRGGSKGQVGNANSGNSTDNTDLLSLSSRRGGNSGGGDGDDSSFAEVAQSFSNGVNEVNKFGRWLINDANQQISQGEGLGSAVWSLFAEDGINAYQQLTGGDYGGAVFSIAMALMKPVKAISKIANRGDSAQYSVSFETKLSKSMYPGRTAEAHFQAANKQLHQQMRGDSDFAKTMESLHPGITKSIQPGARGAYPRRAPVKGATWHHGVVPGQMQLVPMSQHTAAGLVQQTLHPAGVGGMKIWGGGR